MPSELLTTEGLNDLLTDFILSFGSITSNSNYALFDTLFTHGFRIRELKNLQDWTINESDQVIAPTLKNGNERLIDVAELHPLVIASIEEETNFVFISSYDYYKNYFHRHLGIYDLTIGTKSVSTHAFRHNRIKQMNSDGMTNSEIKTAMGLLHDSTVTGYINSQVYAHYL